LLAPRSDPSPFSRVSVPLLVTADACRADGGCPVFQRLLASRLAVANELDLVRPFQRPQKGWIFEFNLKPGF
jgi:hypothetical protein